MKNLMKNPIVALLLMVFVVTVVSCNPKPKKNNTLNHELKEQQYGFDNPPKFRKDGELRFFEPDTKSPVATFDIEIVSNDVDRSMGLMYRKAMEKNQAMLFIFEYEDIQSFWMRNTLISLDMVFVNRDRQIVTIHKNTPTLSDQSFPSTSPAMFVVELNAGTCDSLGINEGYYIDF